jgi:hypothetical protein
MGLLLGLQAFQSDFALGGTLVPTDTVSKVMSGMSCIESDDFWGVPAAALSMTEIILANAGDDQAALEVGYSKLERASAVGERDGVRMVQALQASLFAMQGKEERVKQVIRDHVASKKETPASVKFKLMDEMSTRTITLVSDKLWVQAIGQRTPYGKLGIFWDDKPTLDNALDIDDLL